MPHSLTNPVSGFTSLGNYTLTEEKGLHVFKELRTRWMYWRYRNITRNRQRLQIKWAMRRNRQPTYPGGSARGGRPARYAGPGRAAKSWLILLVAVVGITLLQYYGPNVSVVFVGNIAILAAAYLIWLRFAG